MADNTAAELALQQHIARVRALGSIARDVAPAAADELKAQLEQQIAAGQTPDGQALQRTADGRVPLRNAARSLTVRAIGTAVLARLVGPSAMHHLGIAAGRIRRQILPTRKLPDRMIEALKRVAEQHFNRTMGGR
jgi:hypothetical protein